MPMGLRSAAFVMQSVSSAIVFIHRYMGHWSCNYLDDYGSAEPEYKAKKSFDAMGTILQALGAPEAEEKAVPPCTRMEFLGNMVDTVKETLEVSPDRKMELLAELQNWMHRYAATCKEVQSIIGKLSFVTNCVRAGRIFLSRMLQIIRGKDTRDRIYITEEFKKDIAWWLEFLPGFNGISMLWLHEPTMGNTLVSTDACLTGIGGTCGQEFFHGCIKSTSIEHMSHGLL